MMSSQRAHQDSDPPVTLTVLLQEMGQLETQLSRFEIRFGVKSAEFYQAMQSGELGAFDALDEYRLEFIEWLALYKTWLSLEVKYRQLIAHQPVAVHIKTALGRNINDYV
jgi:hypothetical protein